TRGQQSDTMVRVTDVEVDARHIRLAVTVLMPLEEKVPTIIVARGGTTGIMVKHQVGVLVGFSAGEVAEQPKFGDDAIWVLQRIGASHKQPHLEIGIDQRRRRTARRICRGDAVFNQAYSISESWRHK